MDSKSNLSQSTNEYRSGLIASIGCMALWGVLPIYWKALVPISSWVIIIYRILLVNVFAMLLARTKFSWDQIFGPIRRDWKLALKFLGAGAVITINWSTYIWAVNADHVIQASIGYYIEPLMVCVFGMIFFREKLTVYKSAAMALAALAVVILLVHFHQFPGISIGIALSFAVYSAIKKTVSQPPLISLVYETIFFAPPALALINWLETTGRGAIGACHPWQYALLLLCGLVTVIPLSMFASAAQKVPMFTLGLTEYISPTLSLILGVFFFKEPFDGVQFLAIAVIWVGLVFFSIGELREQRRLSGPA
ncbi:MAG: EamA family transporter RarD [Firmicutes bacterium]|nr:EamA family transporter RarD [Bacillota bacterium]